MNPAVTISLLAAVLTTSLGIYIIILNPRNNINRIFFVFILNIAAYNVGEFLVRTANSPEVALFPGIIAYSVLWISPATAIHFTYIFPRKTIQKKYEPLYKSLIIFVYIFGFLLYILFTRTISIHNVIATEFGYRVIVTPSTLFFAVWFIIICGLVTTILIHKYFQGKLFVYEKNQLKTIWLGTIIIIFTSIFTNFIPPLINLEVFPMTSSITFIFVLLISYAIAKYRLLLPAPQIIADKILETINDLVIVVDRNKNIISANKATTDLMGYDLKDLKKYSLNRIISPSKVDKSSYEKIMQDSFLDDILKKGEFKEFEVAFKNKKGETIPMSISASVIQGIDKNIEGMVLVARDLSEIKKSLKEKEVLLKEIHHRVKNNLQLIISLLELQSDQIDDNKIVNVFQESQNRLRLMSSFYEQLYQSKDVGDINFREYISSISAKLFHSYKKISNNVRLQQNIEDISLDLNPTLLCSFVISELVSNSLKHAFPNNREGIIKIDFRLSKNKYELTVSDDGVGFPKDVDIYKTKTLGIQLVIMFVQQLKGEMKVDRKNGTRFTITFPLKQHLNEGR